MHTSLEHKTVSGYQFFFLLTCGAFIEFDFVDSKQLYGFPEKELPVLLDL